jgi:hypothetical protein
MLKKKRREESKEKEQQATEYFDKRARVKGGSGTPMAVAERVY